MTKAPSGKRQESFPAPSLISTRDGEGEQLTPLNFRVPESFHRDFKVYAAQHGMSMVDLLQRSFAHYQKGHS